MTSKAQKQLKKKARMLAAQAAKRGIKSAGSSFSMGLHKADINSPLIDSLVDRAASKAANAAAAKIRGRGAYGLGVSGSGNYAVLDGTSYKTNSLFEKVSSRKIASHRDETDALRVCKSKEWVMDVVLPAVPEDFNVISLDINPGLRGVFPFLSQIAANYTGYDPIQIVFTYESLMSSASTSGIMGSVAISALYDPDAPAFQTFREMVEYQGTVEGRGNDNYMVGIECDSKKSAGLDELYTRTGSTTQTKRFTDVAKLMVATSGFPSITFDSGTLIGRIYVSYTIDLLHPRYYSGLGNNLLMDAFYTQVNVSVANPFGTSWMQRSTNSIGGLCDSDTYYLPDNFQGHVLVKYFVDGDGLNIAPVSAPSAQITNIPILGDGDDTNETAEQGATYDAMTLALWSVIPATTPNGNYFRFDITAGTTFRKASLIVTAVNPLVIGPGSEWVVHTGL
jgi:hypothetical protein